MQPSSSLLPPSSFLFPLHHIKVAGFTRLFVGEGTSGRWDHGNQEIRHARNNHHSNHHGVPNGFGNDRIKAESEVEVLASKVLASEVMESEVLESVGLSPLKRDVGVGLGWTNERIVRRPPATHSASTKLGTTTPTTRSNDRNTPPKTAPLHMSQRALAASISDRDVRLLLAGARMAGLLPPTTPPRTPPLHNNSYSGGGGFGGGGFGGGVRWIDELDGTGSAPLHVACREGSVGLVELLLRYGANATAVDGLGHSCCDIASRGIDAIGSEAMLSIHRIIRQRVSSSASRSSVHGSGGDTDRCAGEAEKARKEETRLSEAVVVGAVGGDEEKRGSKAAATAAGEGRNAVRRRSDKEKEGGWRPVDEATLAWVEALLTRVPVECLTGVATVYASSDDSSDDSSGDVFTRRMFQESFVLQRRPAVLLGLAPQWETKGWLRPWTREGLLESMGGHKVMMGRIPYGEQYGDVSTFTTVAAYMKQHMPPPASTSQASSSSSSSAAAAAAAAATSPSSSPSSSPSVESLSVESLSVPEAIAAIKRGGGRMKEGETKSREEGGKEKPAWSPPQYIFDSHVLHQDTPLSPHDAKKAENAENAENAKKNGDESKGSISGRNTIMNRTQALGFLSHPPPPMLDYHPRLRQFILGPVLSGAHFHFHGSAWNGLVFGLKLWVLVPPHAAFCAALHPLQWIVEFTNDFNAFGSRRDSTSSTSSGGSGNTTGTTGTTGNTLPLLVLQRPGEIVFVPEGWGHAVLNLADSIGVATEFWPILR